MAERCEIPACSRSSSILIRAFNPCAYELCARPLGAHQSNVELISVS